MRFKACLLSVLMLSMLAFGSVTVEAKTVKMIYANALPKGHIQYGVIADEWIKRIEKYTEGRIKIRHVPGGSLLLQENMLEGIRGGVADFGVANVSMFPGQLPIAATLAGTADVKYGNMVDTKGAGAITLKLAEEFPEYKEDYTRLGVYPQVWVPTSHFSVICKEAVKRLDDFKGKKIRSFGPNLPRMLAAAGATPMAIAVLEVYTSLQTGILDCGMTDLPMMDTGRWYEQAKYMITTGPGAGAMTMGAGVTYMANMDRLAKLPEKDRKILEEISRETNIYAALRLDKLGRDMFAVLEKKGVIVNHLSEADTAELAKRAPDFLKEAAGTMNKAGRPGDAIIKRYQELAEDYVSGKWKPYANLKLKYYDVSEYIK